jgi:RNA polymerase sigma-70 factor (ECF subfamily)
MPSYHSLSTDELVRKCADQDDSAAWEEFVKRFHRLIAKVVLRVASRMQNTTPQTIDDLIQETYLKLFAGNCRVLRNFDHRHPDAFVGFVQVMAANVARDHFKSSSQRSFAHSTLDEGAESPVPLRVRGKGSAIAIEREVLLHEIHKHLDSCVDGPHRDRNRRIFWLYYRTGLSSTAIASLPGTGLTSKGVESVILRITKDLRMRVSAGRTASQPGPEAGEGNLSAGSF